MSCFVGDGMGWVRWDEPVGARSVHQTREQQHYSLASYNLLAIPAIESLTTLLLVECVGIGGREETYSGCGGRRECDLCPRPGVLADPPKARNYNK